MRTRLLGATLTLFLAAGLAGCSDDGASPDGTASITVLLTDAPGDVSKAWVDLSEVYLQGGGAEGGPYTLVTGPTGWIELTELAGRTLELADGVEVPAGSYGQLRFRVERAALLTEGGDLYVSPDAGELPDEVVGTTPAGTLHCPSCGQSGLKANMPGGALQAPGGGSTVVVLDLDVAQSYGHQAGASGKWVMHPVMNVLALELSGRIEGTVTAAEGVFPVACGGAERDIDSFVPTATPDGSPGFTSAVDPVDGTFAFAALPPGSYEMAWQDVTYGDPNPGTLTFEATATPTSVDVASGGTYVVDYEITAATCET